MARLETSSYVKITLIIILALLLFAIAGLGSCSAWNWGSAPYLAGTKTQLGSSSVEGASVDNIDIDWAAGTVDIAVDPQVTKIEFSETAYGTISRAQEMRWEVSGRTLKIDYASGFACVGLQPKDLTIRIPEKYASALGSLKIDGALGTYTVDGLTCKSATLKLASGEFTFQNMKVGKLDLDVASGKGRFDGQVTDELDTDIASGRIDVICRNVAPRSIDADLASGTTSVSIPDPDGFTAKVRKASGTFKSAFPTTQQGDDLYVYNQGGISISIDMASGTFILERTG